MSYIIAILPSPNKHLIGLQFELAQNNRKWAPRLYFGVHHVSTQCLISLQPVFLRQMDKLKWQITLPSLTSDRPKQWDFAFPQAEFAYNSAVNRSTKLSPFAVVYSLTARIPLDLLQISSPNEKSIAANNFANQVNNTHAKVHATLAVAYAKYKGIS